MDLRHSKATLISLGAVDTTGVPALNQVARFFDADTVQGSPNLTFTGSFLTVTGRVLVNVSSDTAFRVQDGSGGNIFTIDTDNGGFVTINNADVGISNGNLRFGSAPAATGTIRLSYTDTIISRNAGDSGDIVLFDSLSSDEWQLGDANMDGFRIPTRINLDDVLRIQFSSTQALTVRNAGATSMLTVDTTNALVLMPNSSLVLGGTPALSGTIRLPNAGTIVFRDSEDTVDIPVISFDESDQLDIGDNSNPGELENIRLNSDNIIIPAGTLLIQGDSDSALSVRTALAGVMFRVNANDREVELTGTVNRAKTTDKMVSALVLTPSGGTATAVGLIPAGAIVLGVTTRVVAGVGGPSGYDVGDGVNTDRWGNSIAVANGTTSDPTDYQSSAIEIFPVATDVVLTSDGVDFEEGSVRVTVHYKTLTAPTT